MIELVTRREREAARRFFPKDGDILLSACLQGHRGRAVLGPDCAVLLAGDFAFAAGAPGREALDWLDGAKPGELILKAAADWRALAGEYAHRSPRPGVRYAFAPISGGDKALLEGMALRVPEGFALRPMDAALFAMCQAEEQLRDLCGGCEDFDQFAAHCAGALAVLEGRPVAGAGTYAWEDGGVEVEIDTLPPFRRQGLACACGAALVLQCMQKGLRLHWDAANETSMRLAMRLGFGKPERYDVTIWD